jgi:hypothetical protein
LTVTLLVLAIHIFRPALFSHIEHKTFDVLLAQTRLRPPLRFRCSLPLTIGPWIATGSGLGPGTTWPD